MSDGALPGEQKQKNLDIKKNIILKDLQGIIDITCKKMGDVYDCHVDCKIDITIIPNEVH